MSEALSADNTGDQLLMDGFFGNDDQEAEEQVVAPEVRQLIDDYLAELPGGRERLIPLLHRVQHELGYLPFPVQGYVAKALALSPIQVYGVVSFYHFFTTTPRGKYQIKVCMGTACFVRQAEMLLTSLSDLLGCEVGSISEDRMFNLDQVRCIGACGLAPAVTVGEEVHGMMTTTKVRNLVRKLRREAEAELQDGTE